MFNKPSKILTSEILKEEFEKGFLNDCQNYKNAKVIVALGNENEDLLKSQQNAGRVNAFLGKSNLIKDSSYEWAINASNNAKNKLQKLINK